MSKTKLIFVYNADSGLFNTVTDIAHKLFSPSTYACALCELTHGYFSMRDEWGDFLNELQSTHDIELVFLHRDEFVEQHPELSQTELPVILQQKDNNTSMLLDCTSIKSCNDIAQLKKTIINTLD